MSLLYVNACVRENSRTDLLAKYILAKSKLPIEELILNNENLCGFNRVDLNYRINLLQKKDFNNPVFKYARQLANADIIVIAAPYWDLSFPALLKAYFENANINGITFHYSSTGEPTTLCKAKKLIYITTAGGYIKNDEFGFGYIKEMFKVFYEIHDTKYFKAEGLDIEGNNVQEIIEKTKQNIDKQLINDDDFIVNLKN